VADEHGTARNVDVTGAYDVRRLVSERDALAAREQTLRQALESIVTNLDGENIYGIIFPFAALRIARAALAADAPAPEETATVTRPQADDSSQ